MMHIWDSLLQLPAPRKSRRISFSGRVAEGSDQVFTIAGPGCIRHWWFTYMYREASEAGQRDVLTAVHNVRLRIYFDGQDTPAVDQPLDTFFGTLLDRPPVEVNSLPITVLKRNGFNSWFPMPFAERCEFRFTNLNANQIRIWFMADLHLFAAGTKLTPLRFGAHYRKLDPAEDYGFMEMADLPGRGFIAGMFHGTDARAVTDAWYHTGGDTWLLDGETEPNVIRGNGGEDLVGYSFGIYESNYPWQGAPWVEADDGVGRANTPCIFYRFFGPDAMCFQSSAIAKFGTKAARVETTLYAYTDGMKAAAPVTIPEWQLCGPFDGSTREAFDRSEFPETEGPSERTFGTNLPSWQPNYQRPEAQGPYVGRWVKAESHLGWIDFLDCFRGINYANESTSGKGGAAYALAYLESAEDQRVTLRLACDDWARLWINDTLVDQFQHDAGFAARLIPVDLRRGRSKILIKLSNAVNEEFYCWAFNLAVLPN